MLVKNLVQVTATVLITSNIIDISAFIPETTPLLGLQGSRYRLLSQYNEGNKNFQVSSTIPAPVLPVRTHHLSATNKFEDDEEEKNSSDKTKGEEDEKDDEDEDIKENNASGSKEMPMKEMPIDPTVKRKKKKGQSKYKTIDNRDSLPFVVKEITPDPYTKVAKKKKEAMENTKRDRAKNKSKSNSNKSTRRNNLLGVGIGGIAASLYSEDDDGSLQRIIGEFVLDKSTTCGDVIEFDGKEFLVQKARCQYKYAGGKKFVMCRKILEVKDVTRAELENQLMKQLKDDTASIEDAFE